MRRLVYAPNVQAFVKTDSGVVDLSPYIVSGSVNRKVNQVSGAQLTVRNPIDAATNRMLLTEASMSDGSIGPLLHPMDPVIIVMQRLAGHPVQVLTGYLDRTPYVQLYPGLCSIEASCTLKRLLYTQWDAALPFVQTFLEQYGWVLTGDNGIANPSAETSKLKVEAGKLKGRFNDGSIGALLFAVLNQAGDWDPANIFIEALPSQIPQIVTDLYKQTSKEAKQSSDVFKSLLTQIIGSQALGAAGPTTGTSSTSSNGGGTVNSPLLNANQNAFASELSAQTGLDPGVVGAWLLAEEPKSAAQAPNGANNWLNMGAFDAGNWAGSGNSAWSTPVTGADATAAWLKGSSLSGLGKAGAQIPHIITTAGQSPQAQIQAIQTSGWASSGYPDLPTLYQQILSAGGIQYAKSGSTQQPSKAKGHKAADTSSPTLAPTHAVFTPVVTANAAKAGKSPGGKSPKQNTTSKSSAAQVSQPSSTPMPLPSKDYGAVRPASAITLIVLHDSEVANTPGTTADLHALFGILDVKGLSVQVGINGDGTVARFVPDENECFHCFVFNPISLGIEQIGFATQTSWPSAQIHATAQQVAFWAAKFNIPLQFSTSHGVCQHKDLGKVGGGHDDCGPHYPFDQVLSLARGFAGGATPSLGPTTVASSGLSPREAIADAFSTFINLPSIFTSAEALAFTGKRSFMADQPLFPFIEQLSQASLRNFMSTPSGDFFAFFPDYFGMFGRKYYWEVRDMEIIDAKIDLDDAALVTHIAVAGDVTQYHGTVDVFDLLLTSGIFDIFDAFGTGYVGGDGSLHPEIVNPKTKPKANPAGLQQALNFLQRYGARPYVEKAPMLRSPVFELFFAFQKFMLLWSKQFQTTVTLTFMPEIFPGGLIGLPDHHLQLYVEEVAHEFDYERGFTTTINVSSPSKLDNQTNPTISHGTAAPVLTTKK